MNRNGKLVVFRTVLSFFKNKYVQSDILKVIVNRIHIGVGSANVCERLVQKNALEKRCCVRSDSHMLMTLGVKYQNKEHV